MIDGVRIIRLYIHEIVVFIFLLTFNLKFNRSVVELSIVIYYYLQ